MSLCLYSFNVRGIRDMLKRKAIFLYLKKFKADFYFLQETHALGTDYTFWRNQWGDDLWLSCASSNSAGVAILKGMFKGKILKSNVHLSGRWVILVLETEGNIVILGNIYGYNNKNENQTLLQSFEEEVSRLLSKFSNANLVLGGDWNTISDPLLDCLPPRHGRNHCYYIINDLCLHLNCLDIWRNRNPGKVEFTWSSKDGSKQSRIDFWLLSEDLVQKVKEIKIIPSILTDHKMINVIVSFDSLAGKKLGFNYWKLNNSLLENEQFQKAIKDIIKDSYNKANTSKMFGKNWEFMKYSIRKFAIGFGKNMAKARRVKEDSLIKDIICIYEKHNLSQIDKDMLVKFQLELDKIFENKAKGAFVRSRRKWLEKGEKNSKYFFNLEKRNTELSSLKRLRIDDKVSTDSSEISQFVTSFYKKLYTKDEGIGDARSFLENIKINSIVIDEDLKNNCDKAITLDEINKNIVKLKKNKSPGNDGLTAEFYQTFREDLSVFLLHVFQEILEAEQMVPTMTQSLIALIPKSGKDSLSIENWRPISLINNDAKLLSAIFAERLKLCLDKIIDDCQSGFMRGRYIGNNIRLVLDLIDYNFLIHEESYILLVDYYKAFDSVDHSFLMETLGFFGFGSNFIRAIRTIYSNCNTSIKLPFGTTPRFNTSRGVKQGDPAAPFLFLLVMQVLCLHIKKNPFQGIRLLDKEIKCSQLADDTTIFLRSNREIDAALRCLDMFSSVSGLTVNINKCELFPLKDISDGVVELCGIPVKTQVSYLGIKICKNQKERIDLNYLPLIDKIQNKFNSWLIRDLSLNGRILLSKAEGLSRLSYTAMVLDTPKSCISQVNKKMYNFIWKNKLHYLNRDILGNLFNQGGLNAIDFGVSNVVFKIKWIQNCIKSNNQLWYYIPNLVFDKIGGINFLLNCNFDINKIPLKLSNFHRQALLSWLLVYKHNFSPHRCLIWNNKDIKYKNKTLFFDYWFRNNIILVTQLFRPDGVLLSYGEFLDKFKLPISAKDYAVVFDAIPSGLLQLMRAADAFDLNITNDLNVKLDGISILDKKCNNNFLRQICRPFRIPPAKSFWNSRFKDINWEEAFIISRRYCVINKIREVSFKIIHCIYPVNEVIKRFKKDIDLKCVFCNLNDESICHLFF